MQEDFHYYATYCAAFLAGYTHDECLRICYSAQFVDYCSETLLKKIGAPVSAATTQMQMELMDAKTDMSGLQNITRIWASFHFLPRDLYAPLKFRAKVYKNKYRLIAGPNGDLVVDTVKLAKNRSMQAVGIAMHVLADTWAHQYFAGTPSLVINNTRPQDFYEIMKDKTERKISFIHSTSAPDNIDFAKYTCSLYQFSENSIMNLGHGRAGHLPDYSFACYRYMPAWGNYMEIVKDNPSDYMHAFCQMVYAMKYLRGIEADFKKDTYDEEAVAPYRSEIKAILEKRQLLACEDWKKFGEKLSGEEIPPYDIERYQQEYMDAEPMEKSLTFLGHFIFAAISQKSMITNRICKSGNPLAGESIARKKKRRDASKARAKAVAKARAKAAAKAREKADAKEKKRND